MEDGEAQVFAKVIGSVDTQNRGEILLFFRLAIHTENDPRLSKVNPLARMGAETMEDSVNNMIIFWISLSK